MSGVGKPNCLQAKVNVWDDYRLDILRQRSTSYTTLAKYPITAIIWDFYAMVFFTPF